MKNRLEAELISIAHRILKLKNKSEVVQLQQETLNLYEKLSVLRFVEENYDDSSMEIPSNIEEKLENSAPIEKETVVQDEVIEEKTEIVIEEIKEENQPEIEDFQVRFEDFEAQLSNAKPNKTPSIFDEVTPAEEPVFVPVQTTTIEQTEIKTTEMTKTTATIQNISINDAVKKNFNIGLNDRVAFEFHLFGGKSDDFNRVISQLNTFGTFSEANDFIQNVVKPDYNNWVAKEEYETRFLEIIESKFS